MSLLNSQQEPESNVTFDVEQIKFPGPFSKLPII